MLSPTALSLCVFSTALFAVDQPGGANSPPPSAPPATTVVLQEMTVGTFKVRIPTAWTGPAGGVPGYAVPGPVAAFQGPDGVWRGHGYLETTSPVTAIEAERQGDGQRFTWRFADGHAYRATLTATASALLISEEADVGPRNAWVFDGYYHWQPTTGLVIDGAARTARCLFMPCYFDRPEASIRPSALAAGSDGGVGKPGGVAIVGPARDVAGIWVRAIQDWKGADTWGIQLWQRRQLPGDPASRHFLGPETKSDSTPNPRTAKLLGPSLYEGHVTIELSLGSGRRELAFAVTDAAPGADGRPAIAGPFLNAASRCR